MAEQVELGIEIDIDDGGIGELVSALKGLDGTVMKVAASTQKLEKGSGKLKRTQKDTKKSTEQVSGAMADMQKKLGALTLIEVFREARAAASFAFTAIKNVAAAVIETISGAQRAEKAFKFLAGPEEGEAMLKFIDNLAGKTELTQKQLRNVGFELVSAGFKGDQFALAMASVLDVAARSPNKIQGMNAAIIAFKQLSVSGKLELDAFKSAGIDVNDFYEALGARLGKSINAAKAQFAKGKVAVEDSLAVFAQIAAGGALPGSLAEEAAKSLEARVTQLKDIPNRFIEELAKSPAADALAGFLGELVGQVGPNSEFGKKLGKGLEQGFAKVIPIIEELGLEIVNFLSELDSSDIDLMVSTLKFLAQAGIFVTKAFIGLFTLPAAVADSFNRAFQAIGNAAGFLFVTVTGFIDDVIDTFMGLFKVDQIVKDFMSESIASFAIAADEFISSMLEKGIEIGASLIDGFVGGIKSKITGAVDAVKNVGSAVVGGLKNILGISSPSRVFMDFGRLTAAGFSAGLSAEVPKIDATVKKTFAVSVPSLRSPVPPVGIAGAALGAAAGGITIEVNTTVEIEGTDADPEDIAAKVSASNVAALQTAAERLNLESPS